MKYNDLRWIIRAVPRFGSSTVDYAKWRRLAGELVMSGGIGEKALLKRGKNAADWLGELTGKELFLCRHCDLPHVSGRDEVEDHNGDLVCSHCYNTSYCACSACEAIYNRGDVYRAEARYWCEDCYQDRFSECSSCGGMFRNGDLDGDNCCDSCSGREDDDGRIMDYSTDVTEVHDGQWLSAPGEATDEWGNSLSKTPTLWMGFELEIVRRESLADAVSAVSTAIWQARHPQGRRVH